MKVEFYGVRGSIPTPGRKTVEYGGNTTCIEVVSKAGDVYIIDAGSGIRELGLDLMERYKGKVNAKLFITHDHWDHLQGFPFFTPAYVPGCRIDVYSGDKNMKKKLNEQNKKSETSFMKKDSLEHIAMVNYDTAVVNHSEKTNHTKDIFSGQQDVEKGYFPVAIEEMASDLTFRELRHNEIVTSGLYVSYMFHRGHPGGMFSYKMTENDKTIVFTGDFEHDGAASNRFGPIDQQIINWARDSDVMVIDAQYTPEEYEKKRGWGHSQIERVCELAVTANIKNLYLTHHDPLHNDEKLREMEQRARNYMKTALKSEIPVLFAKERMIIEL